MSKSQESDSEDFESADEGEAVVEQKSKKASSKTKSSDVTNIPKENASKKEEEPVQQEEQQQSSRWSPWGGAFSIISNASKSVASITTQVSQSITSAIESSINIPEPEEMAKLHAEDRKMSKSDTSEKVAADEKPVTDDRTFKLDSIVSGVSQMSSKLVSGGLDTLEGIGKKTITILQETNPDIKNKIRGINNQPLLSDILKEAKERSDESSVNPKESDSSTFKQVSFDILFEDYKGTVFVEALGILANQSKMKIDIVMKPLDGKALQEIEETLAEVKELCELPDIETGDDDIAIDQLEEKLKSAVEDLNVQLNFKELITCVLKTKEWLDNVEKDATGQSIFTKSIESLANVCALSLGTLHKLAELLLSLDHRSTADEADSLTQLTTTYCHLMNHVASLFSTKITAFESNDENKKFVTNIFLESSNSVTHIKNAFGLFIPILQIGAI